MTTLPIAQERLQHAGTWPPQPVAGLLKEPTAGDVLRIPRGERNALIAIHLFGWQRVEESGRTCTPPTFSTDATADRRVYDLVRTQWSPADQGDFAMELYTIWFTRHGKGRHGREVYLCACVGDYSLAALVVLARRGVVKP